MQLKTCIDFQRLNERIYGKQNRAVYSSPKDITLKMLRYATRAIKGIRKGETPVIVHNTAMTMSWSFALANHFDILADDELWKRFPGVCPYCSGRPCICKIRPPGRVEIVPDLSAKPDSMAGFQ